MALAFAAATVPLMSSATSSSACGAAGCGGGGGGGGGGGSWQTPDGNGALDLGGCSSGNGEPTAPTNGAPHELEALGATIGAVCVRRRVGAIDASNMRAPSWSRADIPSEPDSVSTTMCLRATVPPSAWRLPGLRAGGCAAAIISNNMPFGAAPSAELGSSAPSPAPCPPPPPPASPAAAPWPCTCKRLISCLSPCKSGFKTALSSLRLCAANCWTMTTSHSAKTCLGCSYYCIRGSRRKHPCPKAFQGSAVAEAEIPNIDEVCVVVIGLPDDSNSNV